MNAFWTSFNNIMNPSGYRILGILILAIVLMKGTGFAMTRVFNTVTPKIRRKDMEYQKHLDTLTGIFRQVVNVGILLTALVMILNEAGIQIGPILAAAGVLGLAVGFGAQSLVKDVISGFFILLDDQIRVGDVVQAAGKGGLVERVTLKMTVLRDLAGNVHYIPNSSIDVVTNMTKGYSRYVLEIGVAYKEDVDQVMEIMRKVDEELRADPEYGPDITEPLEILGLDQFGSSSVIIKARITTLPIKQWRSGREFNRRLKKAFDAQNIEIPYPHVTLYMGQDKNGGSAPIRIRQEKDEKADET